MAEIKVEKKNKAPIWPWIIGILILLALIWLLIEAFSDDSDEYEFEEIEPHEVEGNLGNAFLERPDRIILAEFKKV